MMRVTNTTFNMLAANRAKVNKCIVMVQRMRKDGTWGSPMKTPVLGNETPAQVVQRLIDNNGVQFRIALV